MPTWGSYADLGVKGQRRRADVAREEREGQCWWSVLRAGGEKGEAIGNILGEGRGGLDML